MVTDLRTRREFQVRSKWNTIVIQSFTNLTLPFSEYENSCIAKSYTARSSLLLEKRPNCTARSCALESI